MSLEYARLPDTVIPRHYRLHLQPDLDSCTFSGRVNISLDVVEGVTKVLLNAHKLTNIKVIALRSTKPTLLHQKRKASSSPEPALKRPKPCPGRFKKKDDEEGKEENDNTQPESAPMEEETEEDNNKSSKDTEDDDEKDKLRKDSHESDSDNKSDSDHENKSSDDEANSDNDGEPEGDNDSHHSEKKSGDEHEDLSDDDKEDRTSTKSEDDEKSDKSEDDERSAKSDDEKSAKSEHFGESDQNSAKSEESDAESDRSTEPEPSQRDEDISTIDADNQSEEGDEVADVNSPRPMSKEMKLLHAEWADSEDSAAADQSDQEADREDSDEEVEVGSDNPPHQVIHEEVISSDDGEGADDIYEDENKFVIDSDSENEAVMQVDGAVELADAAAADPDDLVPLEDLEILAEHEVIIITPVRRWLDAGHYTLELEFEGILDDSLRGFYRTKHSVFGKDKWGAVCHFEATGARKCFPCFDQPGFRSTFDISVTRPNSQVEVLSNMPALTESAEGVVQFSRTPALPTYLVCIIVGYYDAVSRRTEDGIKISLFTQPTQTFQADFALDVATAALKFFKDFFGLGFTLPKMDLVAIPDFYIGAMENWGLLTFRETALLFHPSASTLSRKQYVAILVCHEIAHQWFGNLVSIAWWDQLWLKEGFATWISFLAVDHLFPEFDIWSEFMTKERMSALQLDVLQSSHPIQVTVNHPGQIDEIFDAISYEKGASVINMLYHWVGRDNFQLGLNRYLLERKEQSAETADLWSALHQGMKADGPSVGEVMDHWTTRKGFPVIKVYPDPASENDDILIEQMYKPHLEAWQVPLRLLDGAHHTSILLGGEQPHRTTVCANRFLVVNAGQTSFCTVQYHRSLLCRLKDDIGNLEARDRAGILSDLASFVMNGEQEIEVLLELLPLYRGEVDWVVVETLLNVFTKLESLTQETEAWTSFLKFAYSILRPTLDELGWDMVSDEGNRQFSRSAVIQRLGSLGLYTVSGEASRRWIREQRDSSQEIRLDIRGAVYRTVARTGGHKEFAAFRARYLAASRAEEKRLYLSVLACFTDYNIIKQLLDWSMSDAVKLQDRTLFIASIAESSPEGRNAAWCFFKTRFPELMQMYTSGGLLTRLVKGVTEKLNTQSDMDDVQAFFKEHRVAGAKRTIDQSLEDVRNLVLRRASCALSVQTFLEHKNAAIKEKLLDVSQESMQYES